MFYRNRNYRRTSSTSPKSFQFERLEARRLLAVVVADYVDDYMTPNPAGNWQHLWNDHGEFGTPSNYASMPHELWRYRPSSTQDFPYLGATVAHPGSGVDEMDSGGIDRYAIAAYTVTEAGQYEITDSMVTRNGEFGDGIEIAVHVNDRPVSQLMSLAPQSSGSFNTVLGSLLVGDTIYVGVGPDGPGSGSSKGNDGISFDYSITLVEVAPVTVSVDLGTKRYLGDVSELNRDKYFTHHSGTTSDAQINAFRAEYDVERGRQFWGPLPYARNQTGQVGVYPDVTPSINQSVRPVSQVVQTGHPRDALRYDTDVQAAAEWVTTYYTTVVSEVPEFYEPMNEPFVHAGDSEFSDAPSTEAMRMKMAELYAAIGEAVDDTPALANMKVVGYASAWPSMELWDFGHWDSRMKMFMDVAGDHIDAFSTHLYDGINVTGQHTRRSGSNSEAILDLIETYSYAKWGFVKPHALTEYGGIEDGYGATYSDIRSAQSLRSINHLLFNFLEREDDVLISIPFTTDKATWFLDPANNCEPYSAALWKLDDNHNSSNCTGTFEYTWRVHFFDLWKDVQGERGVIKTSDPDVQAQLFVDGNTAYVAVNNLADNTQTLNLEFLSGLSGLQNVEIRQMEVPSDASLQPSYTEIMQTTAPESVTLNTGGTAVLVYNFDAPIEFNKTIRAEKHYTSTHLQAINANQAINFNFNGVQTASEGDAILRMSIGRKHNRSKAPTVTVNDTAVDVPSDWKGYDQANRTDFFGMIEIPVPIELLNTNNTVSVTFPDSGGRVSSVILAVEAVQPSAPQVVSFLRDGADANDPSLLQRPDLMQTIAVTFDQDVNINFDDLVMLNHTESQFVAMDNDAGFSYDNQTFTATWNLDVVVPNAPPFDAAYYVLGLNSANISSVNSGDLLDADRNGIGGDIFQQNVYVALPGDVNLDGQVDVLNDAFALVGSLGAMGGATWAQGNFNGDGNVDVLGDAFTLVGQLGQSVIPPAFLPLASAKVTNLSPDTSIEPQPVTSVSIIEPAGYLKKRADDRRTMGRPLPSVELVLAGSQHLDVAFESDSLLQIDLF